MMKTKVLGYSERGIVNSLIYELSYKERKGKLLSWLLDKVYFLNGKKTFEINGATILLEQSFSDFGDADIVLLIDNGGLKQTVFIEVKVKTFEKGEWKIDNEFGEFIAGIEANKLSSSNLFTQLYHKHRLANGIANSCIDEIASKGLLFPECSTKSPRKLGKNKIVLRAAKMIEEYLNDVFFIAIVPDKIENIVEFVDSKIKSFNPGKDPNWQWTTKNWGWLSWQTVANFCELNNLKNTLDNFEHNEEQIFQ